MARATHPGDGSGCPCMAFQFFFGAIDKEQDSNYRENHRKQHGGESLKLTVAILKVAVGLPPGDTDKNQDYYVGEEIGKGVHAVDHHCCGTSEDASYNLQCAQNGVAPEANPRNMTGDAHSIAVADGSI